MSSGGINKRYLSAACRARRPHIETYNVSTQLGPQAREHCSHFLVHCARRGISHTTMCLVCVCVNGLISIKLLRLQGDKT